MDAISTDHRVQPPPPPPPPPQPAPWSAQKAKDSFQASPDLKAGAPAGENLPDLKSACSRPEKEPGFYEVAGKNSGAWDADRDRHLTDEEVEKAFRNPDNTPEQKAALATLRGRQPQLEEPFNDEWGDENDGLTRADRAALQEDGGQLGRDLDAAYRGGLDGAVDCPADLKDKIGTRGYYLERYQDFVRRNPEGRPPDDDLNSGLKYFDRFQASWSATPRRTGPSPTALTPRPTWRGGCARSPTPTG